MIATEPQRFRTIYADPPWPLRWQGGGRPERRRAPTRQTLGYPTMTVEAIAGLPVVNVAARDCALFLWVPASLNREGFGARVARGWGFRPVGEFVWDKGMIIAGHIPRSCHEILLVCRRGTPRLTSETWLPSVQRWRRRGLNIHSHKPEAVATLIGTISQPPYLELFARQPREGWTVLGDAIDGRDITDALRNQVTVQVAR